jgi:DNA/RNA endonuclease G (NUC1)
MTLAEQVDIWCGTYGSQKTYSKGGINITVPEAYYKIIKYGTGENNKSEQICYWMPNLPAETRDFLKDRRITFSELVNKLHYDPEQVLK